MKNAKSKFIKGEFEISICNSKTSLKPIRKEKRIGWILNNRIGIHRDTDFHIYRLTHILTGLGMSYRPYLKDAKLCAQYLDQLFKPAKDLEDTKKITIENREYIETLFQKIKNGEITKFEIPKEDLDFLDI